MLIKHRILEFMLFYILLILQRAHGKVLTHKSKTKRHSRTSIGQDSTTQEKTPVDVKNAAKLHKPVLGDKRQLLSSSDDASSGIQEISSNILNPVTSPSSGSSLPSGLRLSGVVSSSRSLSPFSPDSLSSSLTSSGSTNLLNSGTFPSSFPTSSSRHGSNSNQGSLSSLNSGFSSTMAQSSFPSTFSSSSSSHGLSSLLTPDSSSSSAQGSLSSLTPDIPLTSTKSSLFLNQGSSLSSAKSSLFLTPVASSRSEAGMSDVKMLPNRQIGSVVETKPGIMSLNPLGNASYSLIDGGLHAPNLPALDTRFLANSIEVERPLHIPYKKPEIRLVPKLFTFRYAKKPDVQVSHVHYEQGVNPCQNGGLVVQSPGGYSCVCLKQFRGKNCQERDQCFPNPCKNNGNCIDHVTHFQCRCGHKFRGLKCEVPNTCATSPCKHGATCLDLASGLRCVCPVGYKGKYCAGLDYCNPNPCKNSARCTEKGLGVICTCTDDYKGDRCEVKKVCVPNPCRNNGKCLEHKSSSPCECTQGFTGKYCQENVCNPSPCLNGGVCSFKKSDSSASWLPVCRCALTFKGEKCEIPNPCAGSPSPCKHGVCSDAFNGRRVDLLADHYVCTCHRGYMGPKCDDRICDKCDKNAKCFHEECVCNDGYVGNGLECKKLPDPCIPNPCKNFGVCVPVRSSYDCRCPFSFVGARCEQQL